MAESKFNFTKATLDGVALPVPGSRSTYQDAKTKGLQLRVTPAGIKTFCVFRRIKGGQPERITLGRYPEMTIEMARKMAAEVNLKVEAGENPAEIKRERRTEMTLGDLWKDYKERHLIPQGKKSISAMQETFELYVGKLPDIPRKKHGRERIKPDGSVDWQERKLSKISKSDIQKLHADLGRKIGQTTGNRVLEILRAMFNKGVEWGLFPGPNPAQGITKFKLKSRDRFVQSGELPRLFDALAVSSNTDTRDFVLLSLLTGARKGNVLAMQWCDLNTEQGYWRIPDTKNDEPLTVPLVPEAVAILQARRAQQPANNPWVFPGTGRTGHLTSPKGAWKSVLKQAGLENLRIHDLRRSLGSWQARLGANLAVIGKSLGHKDLASTLIYSRLDLDPVRESVERATSAMFAAAGVKPLAEVVSIQEAKKPA